MFNAVVGIVLIVLAVVAPLGMASVAFLSLAGVGFLALGWVLRAPNPVRQYWGRVIDGVAMVVLGFAAVVVYWHCIPPYHTDIRIVFPSTCMFLLAPMLLYTPAYLQAGRLIRYYEGRRLPTAGLNPRSNPRPQSKPVLQREREWGMSPWQRMQIGLPSRRSRRARSQKPLAHARRNSGLPAATADFHPDYRRAPSVFWPAAFNFALSAVLLAIAATAAIESGWRWLAALSGIPLGVLGWYLLIPDPERQRRGLWIDSGLVVLAAAVWTVLAIWQTPRGGSTLFPVLVQILAAIALPCLLYAPAYLQVRRLLRFVAGRHFQPSLSSSRPSSSLTLASWDSEPAEHAVGVRGARPLPVGLGRFGLHSFHPARTGTLSGRYRAPLFPVMLAQFAIACVIFAWPWLFPHDDQFSVAVTSLAAVLVTAVGLCMRIERHPVRYWVLFGMFFTVGFAFTLMVHEATLWRWNGVGEGGARWGFVLFVVEVLAVIWFFTRLNYTRQLRGGLRFSAQAGPDAEELADTLGIAPGWDEGRRR